MLFKDPKVIAGVGKILTTASRIGEQVRIKTTEEKLQFFVANSSLTVVSVVEVPKGLYENHKKLDVHVKSKALEVLARVISRALPSHLQLEYAVSQSGQELLEIRVAYPNGVIKHINIPCIHTITPNNTLPPQSSEPFTFECLTSKLRDAFSHCDLGADEIKFIFQSDLVSIHTKKLGRTVARSSGKGVPPVVSVPGGAGSGLSTKVTLQPETFAQITVQTPQQLVFKFKEFRTIVSFFHKLGEDVMLRARFNGDPALPTTVLEFTTASPLFPPFEYTYRFLAKLGEFSDQPDWLRVGRQPEWVNGHRRRLVSQMSEYNGTSEIDLMVPEEQPGYDLGQVEREEEEETQDVQEQDVQEQEEEEGEELEQETQEPTEIEEIGFTQAVEPVRGLFD